MDASSADTTPLDSWWLDSGTLPARYWARLRVFGDGSAEVFLLRNPGDPEWRRFADLAEARYSLLEDEFESHVGLIEDGEVPPGTGHPVAASDEELVPMLYE